MFHLTLDKIFYKTAMYLQLIGEAILIGVFVTGLFVFLLCLQ